MKVGQSLKLENSVHGELGVLSPRTPGMARYGVQWAECCVTEHLAQSRVSVCGGEARIGSLMVMVQGPGAAEDLDISIVYSVQYLHYLLQAPSGPEERGHGGGVALVSAVCAPLPAAGGAVW